jgi:chromosome segregation ATPase
MSILNFATAFFKNKGKDAVRDMVDAVVALDPKAASAAQLDVMEKDLDVAGRSIQQIRVDLENEKREAAAVRSRYDHMLRAAELLQTKIAAATETDRPGLEASLAKLVGEIEAIVPDLEREEADVRDVQKLLDEAEAVYKEKADALVAAKDALKRGQRDMERAENEKQRAQKQAERAAQVAGLRDNSTGNGLSVATTAFQRRADEARAQAAAHRLKADTLSKSAEGTVAGDKTLADVLAQTKTAPVTSPSMSPTERLAALKGR